MSHPQGDAKGPDDDATMQAPAVDETQQAPAAASAPFSGAVVDALAWSQEDSSADDDLVPYVEQPGETALSSGRRVSMSVPAKPIAAGGARWRFSRVALVGGIVTALIALAGGLYSLTRSGTTAPVAPVTSTVVVTTVEPSSTSASTSPSADTTSSSAVIAPQTTTAAPATTTSTTSTAPITTTTTSAPATTTTPTTTTPPSTVSSTTSSAASSNPSSPTAAMTTEYLHIPFVPVPIPVTVPQN